MNDECPSTVSQHCGRCGSLVVPAGDATTCLTCLVRDLSQAEEKTELMRTVDSAGLFSVGGFTLLEEIGHGGMGQVFRARQVSPDREVAVKLLMPHLLGSDTTRQRFLSEASAMAELEHPGILPIYASGEVDGRPWIAMKLADRGTLRDQKTKLANHWQEIASLVIHLAEAVHHAHTRGIIHRDLKPGNVLLDEAGQVWVADFGIAKWKDGEGELTRSIDLLGTPAYMAPELVLQGVKAATTVSDVYGLGAILYELLGGQPPFCGAATEILHRLPLEEPPALHSLNPAIPADLEIVCHHALKKSPSHRYQSAAALAQDLKNWAQGDPIVARPYTTVEKAWRWMRRNPMVAVLGVLLIVGAVVAGIWIGAVHGSLRERDNELRTSQRRLTERFEFLLGQHADQMEQTGKLDLLTDQWKDLAKSLENVASEDSANVPQLVKLNTRWARACLAQGDLEIAIGKLNDGMKLADQLPANTTDADDLRADNRATLAMVLFQQGEYEKSLTAAADAKRYAARSSAPLRWLGEASLAIAEACNDWQHHDEQAVAAAKEAVSSFAQVLKDSPTDPLRFLRLISAQKLLGTCLGSAGRTSEAMEAYQEAERTCRGLLVLKSPPEPAWRRELGEIRGVQGEARMRQGGGEREQGLPLVQENEDTARALSAEDPSNLHWQRDLASCYRTKADYYRLTGDRPRELEYREKQMTGFETLCGKSPGNRVYRMNLANARWDCLRAQMQLLQNTSAQPDLNVSETIAKAKRLQMQFVAEYWPLVVQRSQRPEFVSGWKANLRRDLVDAWKVLGQPDAATEPLQEAIRLIGELSSASDWLQDAMSEFHRGIAEIHKGAQRWPEVARHNWEAYQIRRKLCLQPSPAKAPDTAGIWKACDEACRAWEKMNDHPQVLRALTDALACFGRLKLASGDADKVVQLTLFHGRPDSFPEDQRPAARELASKVHQAVYAQPPGTGTKAAELEAKLRALFQQP